jgi:hypothetical protein
MRRKKRGYHIEHREKPTFVGRPLESASIGDICG